MNPPKDKLKKVTFAEDAHQRLSKGVAMMAEAVGSTYGPSGRNVLIKKAYVQPVLTRDGVTVARDMAGHGSRLEDPVATEGARLVYQASDKTNKTAGDGTTATVVLLNELYQAGRQQIVAGRDAMAVKRQLDTERDRVLAFIEDKSNKKVTAANLKQVATVSCGNEALGEMLSDLVWDVKLDGAITLAYQNAPNVTVDKVTGYLFNQGFRFLMQEVEYAAPLVFVTQKRMAKKTDIVPLLELMSAMQRQFIIVGEVADAALETLGWGIQQQKVDGMVVPPPAFGADGHEYFEDIATYCGTRLWLESDDFNQVTINDFAEISRARISAERAILFSGEATNDAVELRIKQIDDQIKRGETSASVAETLEQRRAKLAGKISIVRVGAATEVEREELFFRVEDAVEACKSALSSGLLPGGATTLLFAGQTVETSWVAGALEAPFLLLMRNADERGDYRVGQILNAGYGKGFNLRDMSKEPIDLLKAGVVDATKVVTETVRNAFSVAGALLTTGTTITEEVEDAPTSA